MVVPMSVQGLVDMAERLRVCKVFPHVFPFLNL